MSPGDTVPISITARSVLHLRFSDVPESEMTVEYANADFSPPPTAVWQRIPPTWQWTPPTPVTGDIPLRVSVAVDPGDYHFTIAVKRADTEEEVFKSFTVSGGEA